MASPAVSYARGNQQRFLNELKDLLRIPSISTLDEHKSDVHRAADFVASELRRIGLENVELIPSKGHPLVYAEWLHAPGKPTVLMYAHYDVQPPDPLNEWVTPPFEPTERNNNIYARGAVDEGALSHPAREVYDALASRGASFFTDLVRETKRLPSEVEDALWELTAGGLVTADGFENLRALIDPKRRRGEGL